VIRMSSPTEAPTDARRGVGLAPLLRLSAVRQWLGFSREVITGLERSGVISAFRKQPGARCYYRTQQLIDYLELDARCYPEPQKPFLRRNQVLKWLRVSRWELESWAIHIPAIVYKRDAAARCYFRKSQIKRLILVGRPRRKSKLG
jgi:hypothetical protein